MDIKNSTPDYKATPEFKLRSLGLAKDTAEGLAEAFRNYHEENTKDDDTESRTSSEVDKYNDENMKKEILKFKLAKKSNTVTNMCGHEYDQRSALCYAQFFISIFILSFLCYYVLISASADCGPAWGMLGGIVGYWFESPLSGIK